MGTEIFEQVDDYINQLVGGEDDVLRATIQSITDAGIPPISVSANQGKFLQVLAMTCKAKRILEIGTLAGYSTIWMGRALPKDGKLVSLEYEALHARIAQSNIDKAGLTGVVDIRVGKAIDLLPQL
ncbi:MAG: O-methyltransferase, partial [Marivirga sp.]|nr:O-methyltransferase [Marivirga sp.]